MDSNTSKTYASLAEESGTATPYIPTTFQPLPNRQQKGNLINSDRCLYQSILGSPLALTTLCRLVSATTIAAAATMATSAATAASEAFLDLDVSPIQGQTAWAVLDLQGHLLKTSGDFPEHQVNILFHMLMETTNLVTDGFRRLTVSLANSRFLVSLDDAHIYLVQTRI